MPLVAALIDLFTRPSPQTKTNTRANRVDPDKTARDEPSFQDLHCLPFCFMTFDRNFYLH